MSLYDQIRILRHRETLDRVMAGAGPSCPPLHVRIEPTEACNFRCGFCWWHGPERSRQEWTPHLDFEARRRLDKSRLLRLVDELADLGTQAISFTGAGDPLTFPSMAEVFARIHAHGLRSATSSNLAMGVDERLLAQLARATWVRWSVNAGTREAYLHTNNPRGSAPQNAFDRACENVRRLVQARAAVGDREPVRINASFVVCETNEADVFAAARLCRELGVDGIAFRPDTPVDAKVEGSLEYGEATHREILRAQAAFDGPGFRVSVNEDRLEDATKVGEPSLVCFYSNHTTYVAANGDVYPCCYTRRDKRYALGNVLDRSFIDFWNDTERRHAYRRLSYDRCPPCPYGRTNLALQELYEGPARRDELPKASTDAADFFV